MHPLDIRLAPAAGVCWAATLVGILLGWRAALTTALVLMLFAAAVLARARTRRAAPAVLAVLVIGAGFALSIAWRAHAVATHPLSSTDDGGHATATIVLSDDPKLLRANGGAPFGGGNRVVVHAQLREVRTAGRTIDVGGAVVVLAPADGWLALLPGQRVEVRGRVTEPLHRDLSVATIRATGPPSSVSEAPMLQRFAGAIRHNLSDTATRALGSDSAGLLPGMVVGDTSGMSDELLTDFKVAGLSHLTAVSGANFSILLGAVLLAVRGLTLGPRAGAAIAGVALVLFVVVVRPSPSVLRAAVMGSIGLLALVTGRRKQALPALGGAIIALLALFPSLAVDFGFALSVFATAGLIVLAPSWADWLRARGWPRWAAEMVAVASAAFAVTAPIIVGMSGTVGLVSILANLLVALVVPPVTVLGASAAVLASIWSPPAVLLARMAGPPLWWMVWVARHAAAFPGATMTVPGGLAGASVAAGAVALTIVALRFGITRRLLLAIAIGVAAVLIPVRISNPGWPPAGWIFVACDVGQGDGLVVSTGDGRAVVVDVGPDPSAMRTCLDRLGIHSVALLILSHLHADHITGLAGVLRSRSVAAVALGPMKLPAEGFRSVVETTAEMRTPLLDLAAGDRIDFPSLHLRVLAPLLPQPRDPVEAADSANDQSLVIAADTPAGRLLLTGDVEIAAQESLLRAGVDLHADILKVPHHGSRNTSNAFLAAVKPRLSVISVGADNTFGHPAPGLVSQLESLGSAVARTDRDGDVAVVMTGSGVGVVGSSDRATILS
ncbi:DUF4131 domain-containing protein [Antrihabitans cavernicola]|uniref:DUF4131 domain-containing protein n=1 Tax=Antrihabitans cavernicola TaxID=2495913 RepID=A0A5A7SDB3_9NOCA|nr:DUF4131 domain-containing protein [Spelaeibacter cavernicola]